MGGETIYINLKTERRKKKITQVEAAAILGMDKATYNLKENRSQGRDFTIEEAKRLCEFLECNDLDYLFLKG